MDDERQPIKTIEYNGREYQLECIGRGGSSLVYYASYADEHGNRYSALIKEIYPKILADNYIRASGGALLPKIVQPETVQPESIGANFEDYIALAKREANIGAKLKRDDGALFFKQTDTFEKNNTFYVVFVPKRGQMLSALTDSSRENTGEQFYNLESLHDIARVVCGVLAPLTEMHDYTRDGQPHPILHLDISHNNIHVDELGTVRLIDFNSAYELRGSNEKFGVSCTDGFSALELKKLQDCVRNGMPTDNRMLSRATDLFSVVYLLFFLLKERNAAAEQDGKHVVNSKSSSLVSVSEPAINLLKKILKKGLQLNPRLRYQTCGELSRELTRLIALTNPEKAVLRTNAEDFFCAREFFTGREAELAQLDMYLDKYSCAFIVGEGGCGKTALTREFAMAKKSLLDVVVYMNFRHSLEYTLFDLPVENLAVKSEPDLDYVLHQTENQLDYAPIDVAGQKLGVLSDDCYGNSLLIIDNYVEKPSDAKIFERIKKSSIKKIFISREQYFDAPNNIRLGSLGTASNAALFEHYAPTLARDLRTCRVIVDDPKYIDMIVSTLENSMALVLFAKSFAVNWIQERNNERNKSLLTSEFFSSKYIFWAFHSLLSIFRKSRLMKIVRLKPIYRQMMKHKRSESGEIGALLKSFKLNSRDIGTLKALAVVSSLPIEYMTFYFIMTSLAVGFADVITLNTPLRNRTFNELEKLQAIGLVSYSLGDSNPSDSKTARMQKVPDVSYLRMDDSVADAVLKIFTRGDIETNRLIKSVLAFADNPTNEYSAIIPEDGESESEKSMLAQLRDVKFLTALLESVVFHVLASGDFEQKKRALASAIKYFQYCDEYDRVLFFSKLQTQLLESSLLRMRERDRLNAMLGADRVIPLANIARLQLTLNIGDKTDGLKYLNDVLRPLKMKFKTTDALSALFQAGIYYDAQKSNSEHTFWTLYIYEFLRHRKLRQDTLLETPKELNRLLYAYCGVVSGLVRQEKTLAAKRYAASCIEVLRGLYESDVFEMLTVVPDFYEQFQDYKKFHLLSMKLRYDGELTASDAEDANGSYLPPVPERFRQLAIACFDRNAIELSCVYFLRSIRLYCDGAEYEDGADTAQIDDLLRFMDTHYPPTIDSSAQSNYKLALDISAQDKKMLAKLESWGVNVAAIMDDAPDDVTAQFELRRMYDRTNFSRIDKTGILAAYSDWCYKVLKRLMMKLIAWRNAQLKHLKNKKGK
jgi:serine/threonine protein kinase